MINRFENSKREPFDESFFLHKNIICLWDEITSDTARRIVLAITYLDITLREERERGEGDSDIIMLICSPGGDVTAGMAIYDSMNNAVCDVQTICYGEASSMAALLLSSGTKGKRYAMPNANIMIHQPLGGVQGQATDIAITAKQIIKTRDKVNEIMAKNTGKSIEEINAATERDNYLTPEEALEFGLIDKVLYSTPKAISNAIGGMIG